ncbi:VOC family protein [Pseudonocardia sp. TRM90224]|uniref:VOC family protein n=1 Tax=Pseudonocardia sp. TRM90224 TaxID=2812678 RepID=UPI001E495602|nr:VOC family protein [Pseudonocardia sp. TRM90224]
MQIAIVAVPVRDQDRAREFYVGKLGFRPVADDVFGPDRRWVQLAPPGGGATVTLVTWFPSMPPGSMKGLVIEVADVAATRKELIAVGVAVGEVDDQPWAALAQLDDVDGNGIVLQQSRLT